MPGFTNFYQQWTEGTEIKKLDEMAIFYAVKNSSYMRHSMMKCGIIRK